MKHLSNMSFFRGKLITRFLQFFYILVFASALLFSSCEEEVINPTQDSIPAPPVLPGEPG